MANGEVVAGVTGVAGSTNDKLNNPSKISIVEENNNGSHIL